MDPKPPPHEAVPTSSDPFRFLVESVNDYAIFMLDAQGYVRTWNPGARRIKQYAAEEIIGEHFSTFYPEEDVRAGKCEHELAVASEVGRFEDEGWRLRKDGSRFWANVVISAIRAPDGSLRGFAKITRDLTERRQAEEQVRQSELRLRLLVESIRDYAIFMLDPSGLVTTWNAGAQKNLQYQAAEIIGKHFSVFYPPESAGTGYAERELEVATKTGRYEDEGWRVRKDGSRYWANVVLSAIRDEDGRLVGFAKVTRDLTERKNAEREQAARLAAEEANRAKDEFLAMLGHELRNPLAPTLTALHMMKLRGDVRSAREQEVIERQVKNMIRLVDDLLDLSRITRGSVELKRERVDLRDTIARGVEMASPLIQERRHNVEIEVPPRELAVNGDDVRLAQIFANLLTNAAKYTNAGGKIRLRVSTDGGDAVVEVSDNGVGMAADFLPRIFERFVQAPQDVARSRGGLGLGLTLVKTFVTMHGGTVQAASPGPGLGSTFTVRLPLADGAQARDAPPEREAAPEPRAPADASHARRVLLVDDNKDGLDLVADLLGMAGFEVCAVASAAEALAAVEAFQPEVAVFDIGLPDMDGYELAARVRSLLGPRTPRFIALTGYGQPSDRERSRFAGFDLHLVKPIDVQALLDGVGGASVPARGKK